MLLLFVISLFALIYPYLIYPILVWGLSTILSKQVKKQPFLPKVSLLISAYNESDVIKRKLENCLALDYPKEKLEIVVASESTDETNFIVQTFKDQGIKLIAYSDRKGKPSTLFRTVPTLTGEIVVFSDANAMYDRDAIQKLTQNFSDKRIGCVCGRLKYENPKNSSIGRGEDAYWNFEVRLKLRLSKMLCLGGGVNGSIFAIRKSFYSPINEFRGDDFELSNRIEIAGHGVILEPDAISRENASETSKQEFSRKVRLASWNLKSASILFQEAVKKKKWMTAWIILSHRLFRYFSPFWLILLLVTNSMLLSYHPFFIFSFLSQVGFYALAFSGHRQDRKGISMKPYFLIPFYFCMVNLAAFLGSLKLMLSGEKFLWEKAR